MSKLYFNLKNEIFYFKASSFNKGKYLKKCLFCLEQKRKYESLVFDNYSTDKTLKVKVIPDVENKIFKKKN